MIENSKKPIPVLVSGALGRMGSEVVNTVLNSTDCELVAAIDINAVSYTHLTLPTNREV